MSMEKDWIACIQRYYSWGAAYYSVYMQVQQRQQTYKRTSFYHKTCATS